MTQTTSKPAAAAAEKRTQQQQEEKGESAAAAAAASGSALRCPRCESSNTKFCYFNNYSLSQPRHFCKACKRYWTRGGALRNVPVGGGCRKNKRLRKIPSSTSSTPTTAAAAAAAAAAAPSHPLHLIPNSDFSSSAAAVNPLLLFSSSSSDFSFPAPPSSLLDSIHADYIPSQFQLAPPPQSDMAATTDSNSLLESLLSHPPPPLYGENGNMGLMSNFFPSSSGYGGYGGYGYGYGSSIAPLI